MADNIFSIKITAVDNATKVVNKVNKAVSQVFRPYDDAKKSTKSFFDALGRNDMIARPLSGFQKLGGAIGSIGSSFGVAESSVLASSTRMAASIASIGGPVAAAVAGGVAVAGAASAIAVSMGQQGQSIQRMATGLGMSTRELQIFRSMADQTGISMGTMDSSLEAFAANLTNVDAGMAPELNNRLAAMHVELRKDANGVIDVAAAWGDFQSVLSKMDNPQQQRLLADMAGVGSTLPLLRKTSEELEKLRENALKTGQVMSDELVKKNDKQADSWNNLKASVDGLGTSLGNIVGWYGGLDAMANRITQIAKTVNGEGEKKKKANGFGNWLSSSPLEYEHWYTPFLPGSGGIFGSKSTHSNVVSGKITGSTGNQVVDSANRVVAGLGNKDPNSLFSQLESQYKLPPSLLSSVWKQESNSGDPRYMVSPKGAKGHFGFMDLTAKQYGVTDPNDLGSSAEGSAHMWADLLSKYDGDLRKASVAYNWGQGNLDRYGMERAPRESREYADAMVRGTGGGSGAGQTPSINLIVNNVPAGLTVKLATASPGNVGLAFAPGSAN